MKKSLKETEVNIDLKTTKKNKDQFRIVFNNAADAMIIARIDTGIIIDANQAAANLLLMPLDKIIGMHHSKLHPEKKSDFTEETFKQHVEESAREKSTTPVVTSVLRADGTEIKVEIMASSFEYDGEHCIMGTFRDISERVRLEEEKKRQEYLNTIILQNALNSFWIVELEGRFKEVNKAYCDLIGYSREELLKMSISDVEALETESEIKEKIERVINKGSGRFISKHRCKNGSIIDVDVSVHYLSAEKVIFVFINDLTDKAIVKEILRKSEERYKYINDASLDSIYSYNLESRFTSANKSLCQLLGLSENDIIGKTHAELGFPEENCRDWDILHKRVLETDQTVVSETTAQLPDGKIRHYEVTLNPLHNKENHIIGIAGVTRDITEKKLSEEKIKAAEFKYRTVADYTYAWEFWVTPAQEFIYCSPSCKRITGYEPDDFYKDNSLIKKIIHKDSIKSWEDHLISSKKGEPSPAFELKITTKDGEERWIEHLCTPVFDERGNFIGTRGSNRDISERKKAEQSILHSHDLMKYIIEHTRSAVAVHDRDLNYIYVSQKYLQDYNVKEKNIIGKHHYEIFPDLPQKWREVHQKALKGIVSSAEDDPYYRDNGTVEWTRWECRPWYQFDNTIGGIIVYTEVITARKNIELKLIESEERFKRIVETAEGLFYRQRIDTHLIEYVSPKVEQILGYTIEEFLSFTLDQQREMIHPEDLPALMNFLNDLIEADEKKNKIVEKEFRLKKKSGDYCWVHGSYVLTRDKNDSPFMVIGNLKDITNKKIAELELSAHRHHLQELVDERTDDIRRINDQLMEEIELKQLAETQLAESLEKEKELSKLKSSFISTASHEFRTPLTSISTSAELIQRYYDRWGKEKIIEHVMRIQNSTRMLTSLMDDVLKVNKAESGRIVLERRTADLYSLCKRMNEEVDMQLKKEQKLIFDYNAEKKEYLIDSRQVETIVKNLLSNAIKYSPGGGEIKFSVEGDNQSLKFIISDSGIGIPEADLPRLFEPFHRSGNAVDIQGTGLGLSIVKHAVDLHKGKIEVSSSEGQGTTVNVIIPINN